MFLIKTFSARGRQPVSIQVINVDMMRDPRFPELFRWSYAVLLTLQHKNSSKNFPSKNDEFLGIGLFIVKLQT